ncbi:MAG: hypothetical protein ACYC35_17090, partial [Pirellulales bacterium]
GPAFTPGWVSGRAPLPRAVMLQPYGLNRDRPKPQRGGSQSPRAQALKMEARPADGTYRNAGETPALRPGRSLALPTEH